MMERAAMKNTNSASLVKGALLLTLAGLAGKVLGAGYRIPLQNLLGDAGFYIYQQVYPVLGFALMLALYGFPSAVAKMADSREEAGFRISWRGFYGPLWLILAVFCSALCVVLYGFAEFLAEQIGDLRLTEVYQFASFAFLTIPFTALLRGMYQHRHDMVPVAYSQFAEQALRVAVIIWAAAVLAQHSGDLYSIGRAAASAAMAGAGFAVLVLLLYAKRLRLQPAAPAPVPWRSYTGMLLGIGLVATLNHALLLVIQAADAFSLLPGLVRHGLAPEQAMLEKGIFDRGQPLIQIGSVLGSSFALSVMPAISREKLKREAGIYEPYMRLALKMSLVLGTGAAIGLMLIFPEANQLLFEDRSGTGSLQLLVLAIALSAWAMTGSAMLQGLGYYKRTAVFITCAFAVKWLLNIILVPFAGIAGSALATVLALSAMVILVFADLQKNVPQLFKKEQPAVKGTLLAGAAMALFLIGMHVAGELAGLESRLSCLLYVVLAVSGGVLIYLIVLLRSGAFLEQELAVLPFGKKLMRLNRKTRRE